MLTRFIRLLIQSHGNKGSQPFWKLIWGTLSAAEYAISAQPKELFSNKARFSLNSPENTPRLPHFKR